MASVLAIVSKAVFEKMTPGAVPGSVVATDRYVSSHPAFAQLATGDAIFLVTVRPPDERLWLVAILDKARRHGKAWVGAPNRTPIRDITGTFKAAKGKLAMSLQTPRALTDDVVAALRSGKPVTATKAVARPAVDWAKLKTAYGSAKGLDKIYRNTHRVGAWEYDDDVQLDAAWTEQLAATDPATLEAWACAGLDAASRQPARARDDAMLIRRLEALLRTRSGPLDARYDAVLPTGWLVPAVHERVPPDRLERIVFDRLVSTAKQLGEPDRGWGIGFSFPSESAARFLGLCPSRSLAELVLGLGALSGIWMNVEEEAAKHEAPAVKKVLADFRKRVRNVQSYPRMREIMADWVAPALAL